MALNKYMHSRNIYKNPPNYAELAKKYKEFSDIAKVSASGKARIDFKDPNTLRVLTKCLLKSDFNLDVSIPIDRLVPTLPLRLNYILWVEDLLNAFNICDNVRGLDVGTGACAIYPLLAAVKNKWNMVGTETDEESYKNAMENVRRNNLQDLITLRKNSTTSAFDYLFLEDNEQKFNFTMCNPPFYTNFEELWESRSPARPPPNNGFTGSPQELITEGGELQFCRKMIEESKNLQQKISIFSTMVGHKYNLKELILDLKAEGIKYTTTEFCQGRVIRWGLAWTHQNYDFAKLEIVNIRVVPKKNIPLSIILPEIANVKHTLDNVVEKVTEILQNLKIEFKTIVEKIYEFDIVAQTNTWSNQRLKRRLLKREQNDCKVPKVADNKIPTTSKLIDSEDNLTFKCKTNSNNDKRNLTHSDCTNKCHDEDSQNTVNTDQPILHATMKILNKDDKICLEMEYLDGSTGKDGIHQILQYIKNNWK